MPRRVFFSFHYQNDIWRVNQVRNSWLTQSDRESVGYWDASLWEETKKQGDEALKRLINNGLENTSVTAVLYGNQTYGRGWVKYELLKSFLRGNGMLAIDIHQLKNSSGYTAVQGPNPLDYLSFGVDRYENVVKLYYWNDKEWVLWDKTALRNIPYNLQGHTHSQFSKLFPSYDWVDSNGYSNFALWVEQVARQAGR